jgi:cytoskeleton protein RodZ
MSLREIASATKISVFVLEALERNDFSRLPGGLFSRAFVRAYAREVGLEPEQMVGEFSSKVADGDAAESLQAFRGAVGIRSRGGRSRSGMRWLGLVIGVALVAGYFGLHRYLNRTPSAAPPSAASARPASQAPAASPQVPSPGPVSPSATGQALEPAGPPNAAPAPGAAVEQAATSPPTTAAGGEQRAPAAPAGDAGASAATDASELPLHIVLMPTAQCWVSARVDGRRIVGRTLQAGERVELAAAKAVALNIGDAAAMTYTVNGEPGRVLGAAGQVVDVLISPANARTFLERQDISG